MNSKRTRVRNAFFFSLFVLLLFSPAHAAEDYRALKGIDPMRTVFDFRDGVPETALVHIQLVHETYKDKAISGDTGKPDFVVVFMDSSVKLLSSKREGFSEAEREKLEKMDEVIAAMTQDGVRLEVCLFAAKFFGVDPASITPKIHRVNNGWISSMGYQAKGYSLVPAF